VGAHGPLAALSPPAGPTPDVWAAYGGCANRCTFARPYSELQDCSLTLVWEGLCALSAAWAARQSSTRMVISWPTVVGSGGGAKTTSGLSTMLHRRSLTASTSRGNAAPPRFHPIRGTTRRRELPCKEFELAPGPRTTTKWVSSVSAVGKSSVIQRIGRSIRELAA
jgi:hypothetical protein